MHRGQQAPETDLTTPVGLPSDLSGLHHVQQSSSSSHPPPDLPPFSSPELWHAPAATAPEAVGHQQRWWPGSGTGQQDSMLLGLGDVPCNVGFDPLSSPPSWLLSQPGLAQESPDHLLASLTDDMPWGQLDAAQPAEQFIQQPLARQAPLASSAPAVPRHWQAGSADPHLPGEAVCLFEEGFQSDAQLPRMGDRAGRATLLDSHPAEPGLPPAEWHESAAIAQPSVSSERGDDDATAAALEAVSGSGATFRQFRRAASKRMMREVLLPGRTSSARGLEAARAALQVECERQRLLTQQLRYQMLATIERHAVTQARGVRISELLERLERLRRDGRPWRVDTREVLQIVEDLNDARRHGASLMIDRGWQFGQRSSRLALNHTWTDAGPAHQQLMPMALAYGSGNSEVAQARVSLSYGPLATVPLSLDGLARMTPETYQAHYADFAKRAKSLLAWARQGDRETRAASIRELHDLAVEFMLLDHTFFVQHPAHFTVADAWVLSKGVSPSLPPLDIFDQAINAADLSLEQQRRLWEIWDARTASLQPNEAERERIQNRLGSMLEALQTAESGADYSDVLTLVERLRVNMDEAAVINSVAITQATVEVLSPLQVACIVSTCYPYVLEVPHLFEHRIIPRP